MVCQGALVRSSPQVSCFCSSAICLLSLHCGLLGSIVGLTATGHVRSKSIRTCRLGPTCYLTGLICYQIYQTKNAALLFCFRFLKSAVDILWHEFSHLYTLALKGLYLWHIEWHLLLKLTLNLKVSCTALWSFWSSLALWWGLGVTVKLVWCHPPLLVRNNKHTMQENKRTHLTPQSTWKQYFSWVSHQLTCHHGTTMIVEYENI